MESKILEIFYSNRYTGKQIANEIAKNMKNSKVRQDLIHILDELHSEISTEEMIPIIQEMLKYEDTQNALLSDWSMLVNDFYEGICFVPILIQNEEIKEDMKQYPEFFMELSEAENCIKNYDLIDIIWDTDNRSDCLKEELVINLLNYPYTKNINILLQRQSMREFLSQNIKEIIENCSRQRELKNFVYMLDQFNQFPELQCIYNENKFVMDLYHKAINYTTNNEDIDNLQKSIYNQSLASIIGTVIKMNKQEEIELELKDLSKGEPIEFLSMGGYSLVFETNEKVFKLGNERTQFPIEKYHKRFMYPILRKNYDDSLYIEAFDKGEIDSNITNEELLMVYEELYRAGFIWLDAKKENLVRLKEDMVLPGYVRQRDDTHFGFKQNSDEPIILKKGELAICDLDFIYYKDDPKFISGDYVDCSDDIVIEFRKKLEAEERAKESSDLEK